MINHTSRLLCGLSVLALMTTAAQAQEAAAPQDQVTDSRASGGPLGEIVVTAQKRTESIQDVPISITALGGEQLANSQVTSLQALQGSVPNVQIGNFANTINNAVFSIRGIGVIEPDPYAGNTVSIVVDGVPQFFSLGALVDTFDIERVEILRGPQGTLFGANTTGGVVNVVSRRPGNEFEGYVKAMAGNWNRFDISGAINIPLADDLAALRISGIHTERDGWHTNVWNGKDMGSRNVDAVRGQLLLTPSSNLEVTLQGEYVASRNGAPVVINGAVPGEANYVEAGSFFNGALLPNPASACAVPGERCRAPDRYYSGNNEVPDLSNMDTYFAIGTINWSETPIGDITSITAYKDFKLLEYTDQDGTSKSNNSTRRATKGWQFSQELRTDFEIGDRFNAVAGVFFMKTHYDHYQLYKLDFALPGLIQFNTQEQDTESYSAFMQSYFDVTDRLKLSAGIRFTHDKIDARSTLAYGLSTTPLDAGDWSLLEANSSDLAFAALGRAQAAGDLRRGPFDIDVGGKKSWDNLGWKLGLDYQLGPDQLVYASWARGFKSGGFTGRIGVAADGDTPYNPEEVDTFEVGAKADLLGRRLRLNAAAFLTKYRDMQLAQIYFVQETNVQGNRIINAAESEIKGFELEAQAVPVDGLTLRGSVAYLDAKYEEFLYFDPITLETLDLSGFALQNAPKWAATAGLNYAHTMGDNSEMVFDVSWRYSDEKYYTAIVNTPRSLIQSTSYVDTSLTFYAPDRRYQFSLWGKNIFDKRDIAIAFDSPGYMAIVGYAPPREYGISAQYNF